MFSHLFQSQTEEKIKKKVKNKQKSDRSTPYHIEHTSSHPISEVKQHLARIVLRSETAWDLLVLLAFKEKKVVYQRLVATNTCRHEIFFLGVYRSHVLPLEV